MVFLARRVGLLGVTATAGEARYRFREYRRESDLAYSLHIGDDDDDDDGSVARGAARLSAVARKFRKTGLRALRVIDSIIFLPARASGGIKAYLPRASAFYRARRDTHCQCAPRVNVPTDASLYI